MNKDEHSKKKEEYMSKTIQLNDAIEKDGFSYNGTFASSCVLCGNDLGKVHFKGKMVCEDCLDFMKGYK